MSEEIRSKTLFSESVSGFACVLISAVCFQTFSRIVSKCLTPKTAQHSPWRWKNILVSFVHSVISGTWAVLCFYEKPQMAEDLISTYTPFSYSLVAMSIGYFIYDTVDMLVYNRGRQTAELVLHHFVIIICFGIAVTLKLYVGYAVVALIVELNSIFLHLRQLFQVVRIPRDSSIFRANSLMSLGTYIAFRISTLAWMTRWIVVNRDLIPLLFYTIGSIGLAIMTVMNIVLFCRLLYSDFFKKRKSECANHVKED